MDIDVMSMPQKDFDELRRKIREREYKKQYNDNIDEIICHREYTGRCYFDKQDNAYLRVLSAKSSNDVRMECLTFKFPVVLEEREDFRMVSSPDDCFSEIENEFIHVEDFPFFCYDLDGDGEKKVFERLVEITEEEFFRKMDEYVSELKQAILDGAFDTAKGIEKRYR